jgi:hypothetical protein
MKKASLTLLLVITCAAFIAGAWYSLGRRIARGEKHSPYSSYRSDRTGTRRLFLFYEDAGLEPVRLKRELIMLEERGLLFIIEPQQFQLPAVTGGELPVAGMFLPQELDAIISWVGNGNSLVLAASRQNELHERLGIRVEPGSQGRRKQAHRVQLSPLTRSPGRITSRRDSRLVFEGPSWVELFAIPGGGGGEPLVQAAVRKLGEGSVVVLSEPFVLTNKGIAVPSNLTFAARLAGLGGAGRIYFDEYRHGFSDPRTIISYIRERRLHFALLQVMAVFLLFVWRGRSRLGKPRRLERSSERGSAEYVRAFSLIYRRAHLHGSVIRSAYELLREKVALRAGLGRGSGSDEIYAALRGRNEKAALRFREIAARASALGTAAGDAEVLAFTRMAAKFEKEGDTIPHRVPPGRDL